MRLSAVALLLAACAAPSWGANLDLTASYRIRGIAYSNLNLDSKSPNNHSFVSNNARLGFSARKIVLASQKGEDTTLDIGVTIHGVGIAGSTSTFVAPFNAAAENYPSATMTPFIENAYATVHNLFGYRWDATFGRQTYRLGGGLLLDDDGAGLTGVSAHTELPWFGLQAEAFGFSAKNSLADPNSLTLAGASMALPLEGTWSVNYLYEHDRSVRPVFDCSFQGMPAAGCFISQSRKHFGSIRYSVNYGSIVFDGEAAIERGVGTPTGNIPSPAHIYYSGDAQVLKAKWKQKLYKIGEGVARMSVARGSGNNTGTGTRDEAFFPAHGHRFDGLERSGFGDFFAATPYDAYGGTYSTGSASGMRGGVSGIVSVGAGYTLPAWKGFVLDVDYFLYQADRVVTGSRSLGSEWDAKIRYQYEQHFSVSVAGAWFGIGKALNATRGTGRKITLEASGRF
jgi:hypothetical protein